MSMDYPPHTKPASIASLRNEPAPATPAKDEPALHRLRLANGGTLDRLRHALNRLDMVDERLRVAIAGPVPKNADSDKVTGNAADMSLAEQSDLGQKLIEQLYHLIDRLQQHAG